MTVCKTVSKYVYVLLGAAMFISRGIKFSIIILIVGESDCNSFST